MFEFPDGKVREVEVFHIPDTDVTGAVLGAFVITHDVTQHNLATRELAESRKLLQETIDAAPVSISIKDRQQRYVFANDATQKKLGVAREEMIGRTLQEAIPGSVTSDTLIAMAVIDNRLVDTGEPFPFTSFDYVVDGELRNQFVSKTPIKDDSGTVTYIVTVSVDVTELKQAEAFALAAKDEAELANMAKSEFLANMSHELRTPLNAIIGFSEIMQSETFGPLGNARYVEYAKDIHDSGDHLHTIITDLLDLSRIEVGAVELDLAEVDLGEILDSTRTMLEPKARKAGVTLIDRCERPLPPIRGDRVRLRQIFINLIDNAIKFTDAGGEISISADTGTPGMTAVTVSDTGIGIDAADIERIVEPFVSLQSSSTRNVGGTGLGLSLVKSLTEMQGGELRIDSEVGRGTSVTVTLPCAIEKSSDLDRRRSA